MQIFTENQQNITRKIESKSEKSNWVNWKWHVRHTIKTISEFEKLTGITFSEAEKKTYKKPSIISLYPLRHIIFH